MSYVPVLIIVAAVAVAAYFLGRRYLATRGDRLVQCPENRQTAAVTVGAARAALGGGLRLNQCSRWPERGDCGRECLAQIERAPDDCLVRNIVAGWYEGKKCAVCAKPMKDLDWFDRKPGLADEKGTLKLWAELAPETLPQALERSKPVCFDCYVAETFRQEHPELVIDNPWQSATKR